MAGKSGNPSHEHPRRRRKKTGTCRTDKRVERKGGTGVSTLQKNANAQKKTDANKTATMPYGARTRGMLVHAHI